MAIANDSWIVGYIRVVGFGSVILGPGPAITGPRQVEPSLWVYILPCPHDPADSRTLHTTTTSRRKPDTIDQHGRSYL